MDNKFTEELYSTTHSNTNPNEIIDDEPYPPPGLNRVVPGQTVSFDDGLNSPSFARIIPGEGNDHTNTYQVFSTGPKISNTYGHNFNKDGSTYGASKDFFDSYLHNAFDVEPKSNQPPKNKFPDTEKRENYLQQNIAQLPINNFDNLNNEKVDVSFNNYHNRPTSMHSKSMKETAQFEGTQPLVGTSKPEIIAKFEGGNFFQTLQDNDQLTENKERTGFFQNNFNSSLEKDKDELESNLPPSRMAIEGSCDNGSYLKSISSSTPVQSPSFDYWYSNNSQSIFAEYVDATGAHTDDSRQARDPNTFYAKTRNTPMQPSLNPHFLVAQSSLDPHQVHSKTPSIASNTSSLNEPSSYQTNEKYNAEQKRGDHFNNVEATETGSVDGDFEVQTNTGVKSNAEKLVMNVDTKKTDEYASETRPYQKFEVNRKNYGQARDEEDREQVHFSDSDERGISKRMVVGHNNTLPKERKTEKLVRDARASEQYRSETYQSVDAKLEPPLGQRMVVGETSSDAPPVYRSNRTRNEQRFNDEKHRRSGSDLLSKRSDKNKKMHDTGHDRREVESGDEDYNSLHRNSHSYHDKHYRNSPRRLQQHLPRRPHENSIIHSQDESYYDDDEDEDCDNEDDYPSYNRNYRKQYDRRPLRESNYRPYGYDPHYRDDRQYQRPPEYFEADSYYVSRSSRPSSRTGSELYHRPLSPPNQMFYAKGYKYLNHRQFISHGSQIGMSAREFEELSHIRRVNPPEYICWFRDNLKNEYAEWYSRFYGNRACQADRRGSGHSGQSSVNNDVISVKDEKLSREQSLFKPVATEVESGIQEARYSPSKYTVPHVKGVFNPLGQLLVVNACSPQDNQPASISIYSLLPPKDADWREFLKCTGPFVVGETHVSTVSDFVKRRADEAHSVSERLLYLLIDLIIKLRGVTDGIAISELLISSYRENGCSFANLKEDCTKQPNTSLSESEIIEEYINLMLQGNKNSALEWAVNHKLWDHAFLLASKMGTKYYSNLVAKLDARMSINNPLKTFYQLHSNQIPLSVTACGDEKWGDWRPHLAMILSNPTTENELDKTAIITLGDSLAHKDIYATHFCYLAAEWNFDLPTSSSKMTLLTVRDKFDNFKITTPNHAILLTQMYEFAKRLQRKDYTISALLPFKYLLATRLLDYGRSPIALQYLESIAVDLMKDSGERNLDLIENVVELSERIKYSDSKPLVNDSIEKQWLTNLKRIVDERHNHRPSENSCYNQLLSNHSNVIPGFKMPPSTQSHSLPTQLPQQSQMFNPSDEVQSHFRYQPLTTSQPPTSLPTSPSGFPSSNQLQLVNSSEPFMDVNDNASQRVNDFNQPSNADSHTANYNFWDPPQPPGTISMHSSNNYFNNESKSNKKKVKHDVSKTISSRNNPLMKREIVHNRVAAHSFQKSYLPKRLRNKNFNFYSELSVDIVSSASSRRGISLVHALDKLLLEDNFSSSYFDSLCNSRIVFNGTYPIDKPFAIRGILRDSKIQLIKENAAQNRKVESRPSQQSTSQESERNNNETKTKSNKGGLFSMIKSAFGGSNATEMKLPEDKSPAIIYDKEKKRWVNTEEASGDDNGEVKPPPPAANFNNYPPMNNEHSRRLDNVPSAPNMPSVERNKPSTSSMTSSDNVNPLSRGKSMKPKYVQTPNVTAFSNVQLPPNMNLFAPAGSNSNSPSMSNSRVDRNLPDNAALVRGDQNAGPRFYNPSQFSRF